MSSGESQVAFQFLDRTQERTAAHLGMWVFLGTEVLFLGALFAAYIISRVAHPEGFAEASRHTLVVLGTANTILLLTSSLTMALAVHAAREGDRRRFVGLLAGTALLGALFLVVKGFEYHHEYASHLFPGTRFDFPGAHPQAAELFYWLYFVMTGVHALHLLIGVVAVSLLAWLSARGRFGRNWSVPIEMTGLYWHFVDLVWVFLYPLFYLVSRA